MALGAAPGAEPGAAAGERWLTKAIGGGGDGGGASAAAKTSGLGYYFKSTENVTKLFMSKMCAIAHRCLAAALAFV